MSGPAGGVPGPRRYGDREVARILKRAAELQRAEPSAADPEGLTLDELAEIAREAGIHPDLLRRAAAEAAASTPASTLGARLAGAPVTIRLERVVAGELPLDRFEAIVPRIQQATDGPGTASAIGRTLTWSSQTNDNTTSQQVLVSSMDGQTLIRWEERFTGLAGALFGGIMGGGGGGIGIGVGGAVGGTLGSTALGVGIPLVAVAGSYALARFIFRRIVRRREAAALAVIEEIAAYVAQVQAEVPATDRLSGDTGQRARLPGEGQGAGSGS